jgi:outer membrane protein assembly factor BamB
MGGLMAVAEDWPCWRGPNHDGISPDKGLRTDWDAAPPTVWQAKIGAAFSAVVCVGDRVYTCGARDGQQVLLCLNADDGKEMWCRPFEKHYPDGQGGDGTRGTPTVDEGRVYVQGGWGRLICVDAVDGKGLWSHEFNAKPQWGYSGSVLIEGDLAIVAGGDEGGPLVALDKTSGKVIWKCGRSPVGYSTPYPFTFEGRRYVIGLLGKSAVIADVRTGREVWSMPWETSYDVNAATPIFHDGVLTFSSGYGHGSIALKLAVSGDKLTTTTLWEGKAIRAKFQSPVLYEGHLYTSDEVGLKCVSLADGEVKWRERGIKFGTVVVADGYLYLLTENGELMIARATPEAFTPRSKVPVLDGRCWTVPTVCNGRLYARNLERMICLNLRP